MKPTQWIARVPWIIVLSAIGLMALGLSGIVRGDELSGVGHFYSRQVVWIVLGLPTLLTVTLVPYRHFRGISYGLFGLSVLLLFVVFFMPAINYSHRWIPLGFMNFQPSEMAKLAYILALAHYLIYRENYRRLTGLLVPFVLTLIPVG